MPIDYSKFDCIDTDSDDDSAGNKRRAAPRAKAKAAGAAENAKISMAKPEAAAGSSWNHKSWHFEEMKADDWAKGRLTELFREFKDKGIDVTHEGADLRLDLTWREARAVTGSAWNHIRKGVLKTGYDMEIAAHFQGALEPGGWPCEGTMRLDLTVDDDDPDAEVALSERTASLPFARQLKRVVVDSAMRRCAVFVGELRERGKALTANRDKEGLAKEARIQSGQFTKYSEGPDGTAALAEAARKAAGADAGSAARHTHTHYKHTTVVDSLDDSDDD